MRLFRTCSPGVIPLFLATTCLAAAPGAGQGVELTLREAFGVAHADQVVDFDLPAPVDAAATSVIGPVGKPVAFQVLRGNRLAVRTDLPAGATRTWHVVPGSPPAPAESDVREAHAGDYIDITNGLTGVRIPNTWEGASSDEVPAPVQGIRWRDGSWTTVAPNALSVTGKIGRWVWSSGS